MLKEKYSHISFPLDQKDPDSVTATYLVEFGQEMLQTIDGIRIIFAHALRDYLENKIGEWEFGSLCFFFITQQTTNNELKKDQKLEKYVLDCTDIKWLANSKSFEKYKDELRVYLKEIIELI